MHRDGFGFVTPDTPLPGLKGDIYIPKESAERAMHGDRVGVRIVRMDRDGRATGDIVNILRRAHTSIVGEFHVRRKGFFVSPHDSRIRQWIHVPGGFAKPKGSVDRVGEIGRAHV